MGGINEADGEPRRAVAVVDDEVRESGWQRADLDLILEPQPKVTAADLGGLRGSVRFLPQTGAELAGVLRNASAKRVPASAFVSIGRAAATPRNPASRSAIRRVANDNKAPSAEKRSVWRDLFFLAVLAATVLGAFWSGRMQGYQKVIVVPGPSSFYSVVT